MGCVGMDRGTELCRRGMWRDLERLDCGESWLACTGQALVAHGDWVARLTQASDGIVVLVSAGARLQARCR